MEHGEVLRLYDEHGGALLAYASSLLRDPSAAEDVVHQVFLKLLGGAFAINGQAVAYLFRAVRNTALNHIRGQSREVDFDQAPVWLERRDTSRETSLALQSALARLPQEQREIVVLHVWGQLTFEEAASVAGISLGTAASRYRYGIAKLKEIWNG